MSIDESKNDSRKILPKINWESNKEKEQYSENVNSLRLKKSPYFKPLKPLIKRTPTNYHLIKILKLKKETKKNNIDDLKMNDNNIKKNYSPQNHRKNLNRLINEKKIDIIQYEFPLLNNSKNKLQENNENSQIGENSLNKNDIYRINHINKEHGNKSAIISNKLIANRILSVKLSNKGKNNYKKYMIRNKHYWLGYSPSSAYISFSNESRKNNNSMINLHQNPNTNINNSVNIIEPKLNVPSPKGIKDSEHGIFISKLNIKSISDTKRYKSFKYNGYVKKWDLPKSFSFDKITGREKEIKNPIKLHHLERLYEYTPKYDSILSNNNKSIVKYNHDIKNDFRQYKINSTRKYLHNRLNIMNNPSNNYNIINILNEQKIKEQQKLEKKRLNKILEEFVNYHKSNMNV